MIPAAHLINLNLPEKLRDRSYRQKYFLAETSAQIAKQLIALRKRRSLSQKELAELVNTQQPAISRVERADYQNWSFNTLRSIAGALDARIRVSIQPSEDILHEYEESEDTTAIPAQMKGAGSNALVPTFLNVGGFDFGPISYQKTFHRTSLRASPLFRCLFSNLAEQPYAPSKSYAEFTTKDAKLSQLEDENRRLREENLRLRNAQSAMSPFQKPQPTTPELIPTENPIAPGTLELVH
jgi:transcriptional regulator with XRE-family HTH domain